MIASEHIKCMNSVTFPQKLYQLYELTIAEEFEQAIQNNSLEKIKHLFSKVLEIGENS